jgi:hypothetical protein
MWRWAKHWVDWVRNEMLPLARTRRSGHTVLIRYEAVGQTYTDLPVPWSADVVIVEIILRLPPVARRKTDFALQFPDSPPVPAENIRPETGDRFRVGFRLPVPCFTSSGDLLWKHRVVAPITVPVLTANTFLGGLSVGTPTLAVRLGEQAVAARAFVADGCKGIVASVLLRSLHRLGPAADLGLTVEFRNETTGRAFTVPTPLTAEQRLAREAIIVAACPKIPRRPGWWHVIWRIGEQALATVRFEVIAARRFEDTVRVVEARFAVAGKDGLVRVVRQTPPPGTVESIGPCFLVTSGEPGTAGRCRFTVFAMTPGSTSSTQLLEQEMLVTDAPTPFAPGLLGVDELAPVGGFELRLNGRILGTASLSPVPPAILTAEGGFKPPPDFPWTSAAEDELSERLRRLGGGLV